MNPIEVVLRKEGDGKGYYERCGAEAGVPGLSRIFDMFSRDEVRHADALRALVKGARVELAQSQTLDGAKCILRRLSVQDAPLSTFHGNLGSYGCAMDFEAASARACGKLALEAPSSWEKELYLKIAADDEMHFTLLEHIRELLESASRAGGGEVGGGDAN